jgi:SAM-dependent MidA family methyltransferase
MPVELFKYEDSKRSQLIVNYHDKKFRLNNNYQLNIRLKTFIRKIRSYRKRVINTYVTEKNTSIYSWLDSIYKVIDKGVVFIVDYGYHHNMYYISERCSGTLRCYYKHYVHNNPFINLGIQDITSHVDFTSVVGYACALGFSLMCYTTQSNFLLASGIRLLWYKLKEKLNIKSSVMHLQELKILISNTYSESTKVVVLSLNYKHQLESLENVDMSHLLKIEDKKI